MTRKGFERAIGGIIRKLRLRKNLTVEEAAQICICSAKELKHYESLGSNSIRVLLKIAISLDGSLTPLMVFLNRTFSKNTLSSIPLNGAYSLQKRNINIQEILFYLKKENRPSVKEKLQALSLLSEGMTVKKVAIRLGKRPGLIQQWLWRYNKNGIRWFLPSC